MNRHLTMSANERAGKLIEERKFCFVFYGKIKAEKFVDAAFR